jgi:hypothetical protein
MVNIIDGVITWVYGDQFSTRWLPGTLMLIGSPTQNAYSLTARPLSATQIVIADVTDTIGSSTGTGVPYNIAQPILAQQPLASIWGPDATGYIHGCGDTNQPEAYVWTKAYNGDSAPQTNRLLLSTPSEALMGGELVNGVSMVFSTQRAWLMMPNFADAQATTSGTTGSQWNPVLARVKEGLFIRNCLCSIGGKTIAYRVSGGISITSGGPEKSLTDDTLYPVFPHEGFTPQPVTVGPYTVWPPNDSLPQKLAYQNGYIYYDYQDVNGVYRTLVYDEEGKGWSVDMGTPTFSCHSGDYAAGVNDTAVGCSDGTVRVLKSGGAESATSVVATGADNAGDARALKRVSDVFIRALVQASNPITAALYSSQYASILSSFSPTSLTGAGILSGYILGWGTNTPSDVQDLALSLSWNTNAGNEIDLWQPGMMDLPIAITSRATEALTHRLGTWQHAYMVNLMVYSTAPVTLTFNTDQGTFSMTWPASGGSLFEVPKVVQKCPWNKFKTCAYQISSSQPFYIFGCEVSVKAWGRVGSYEIFRPFSGPADSVGGVL